MTMEQFVASHPGVHTNHSMMIPDVINRKIQISVHPSAHLPMCHPFCSWRSYLTRPYMEWGCGQPPSSRQTSLRCNSLGSLYPGAKQIT